MLSNICPWQGVRSYNDVVRWEDDTLVIQHFVYIASFL